jgi:N-acetylglucosaminyldiphosphoundecaprenol N-acetyl-beta-D-mannosaminyltransferase
MNTVSQQQRPSARRQTVLRHAGMDRVGIGHALVDNCSFREICVAIVAHAKAGGKPSYVTTPNAQHIVLLDQDRRLREIYDCADLVVPDGISLLLAARLYGRSLRERVAGVDMFQTLCGLAAENNLHVFLLGGRPNSADLTAAALKRRLSILRISTYCPPFGFEKTAAGLEETAQAIRAASPDLLFVAFGTPKQEYWIYEHGLQLSVPICVGVGGAFEMVAGVARRAPLWIQNVGCEWLYRLCLEPRRMWRRYVIGNPKFAIIVIRQCLRRAFLATFFSLVDKDRFAAELYEPCLQHKREFVASVLNFRSREMREGHDADPLNGNLNASQNHATAKLANRIPLPSAREAESAH